MLFIPMTCQASDGGLMFPDTVKTAKIFQSIKTAFETNMLTVMWPLCTRFAYTSKLKENPKHNKKRKKLNKPTRVEIVSKWTKKTGKGKVV